MKLMVRYQQKTENQLTQLKNTIALIIGIYLIKYAFIGAIGLLEWAGESGFIGVAAYFACWVFLFSLMLIGSIITGALASWSE